MSDSDRVVKYVGDGAWFPGIPARDLTLEEYEKYRGVIEELTQPLYIVPEEKPKKGSSKKSGDE